MRHKRSVQSRGVCKHSSSDVAFSDQRTYNERMRRQHANIQLHCSSRGNELPMDSADQCHDCIWSGYADGNGFVCLELRCKRFIECEITKLFWIERSAHLDGLQLTGNAGRHQRCSEQRMQWLSIDLHHCSCSGSI